MIVNLIKSHCRLPKCCKKDPERVIEYSLGNVLSLEISFTGVQRHGIWV